MVLSLTHKVEVNAGMVYTHKALVTALKAALVSGEGAYIELTSGGDYVCDTYLSHENLIKNYDGGTFDRLQGWISGGLLIDPNNREDTDDDTDCMHWR